MSRKEKKLEERVLALRDFLSKLVVVSGEEKSGKTVLVEKVFPRDSSIWIDGKVISNENDFWDMTAEKADLLPENGRSVSSKAAVVPMLQTEEIPLIVDNFHCIGKEIQKSIVRALKAPIMHGLLVIFITVPDRKYAVIEIEREMTGRIENIEIPVWEEYELKRIAEQGFEALNIQASPLFISKLSQSAYGNPFFMQRVCRTLCEQCGIEERMEEKQCISDNVDVRTIS